MPNTIFFTCAYNAENTIRRTIESVSNQTSTDFEYYILDNGSITRKMGEIINGYADVDSRIKPLRLNVNDITNAGVVWTTLCYSSTAKYIVWLDADDAYTPDFLENMTHFAEEERLDVASCGYEKIDGITGEVLKSRALKENLVLYGDRFTEEFIQYRGFTSYLWGKLYSIPFVRDLQLTEIDEKTKRVVRRRVIGTERNNAVCNDSAWVLNLFKYAERAGVYGKVMHHYYQYPNSISHQRISENLDSYEYLWKTTKDYLEYYGPISQVNEDFLYAIYLSLVDEMTENVFNSNLDNFEKLRCLEKIFSNPRWQELFERTYDPQFRNLAALEDFYKKVRKKTSELVGKPTREMILQYILRR